ncbi:hypothetical protein L6164_020112 [Bauhinia variegata]|uniref:Uncharacterized protein n=1 Tax=Bauhinia variegata TaxID=167791 RepID=A0ACB9MUE2_BAUVA|nr:hypothetical protein L6164_020112 [Bauhinia variegata]
MALIKTPYANSFAFLNSDEDEAQLVERVSALLNGNGTQKERPDAEQNRNPNGGYQQWVKQDEEKEMKAPSDNGSDDSWQHVRSRKGRSGAVKRDQQGQIGNHGYYQGRGRGRGKGATFRTFGKGNHNRQQLGADAGSEFTSSGKNGSCDGDDGHRGKPPPSTNPQALEDLKKTNQERVVNPDDSYNMKSQDELVNVKSSTKPNKDKKPVRRPTTLTIDDFFPAPKGRRIPPKRNNKKHMEVTPHKTTQEPEQVSDVLDLYDGVFPVLTAPQRA